jgi:hypothetical protein
VFGDQVVAKAILDRLLHHSHVLTIRGDSYRLREKRRSGLRGEPRSTGTDAAAKNIDTTQHPPMKHRSKGRRKAPVSRSSGGPVFVSPEDQKRMSHDIPRN